MEKGSKLGPGPAQSPGDSPCVGAIHYVQRGMPFNGNHTATARNGQPQSLTTTTLSSPPRTLPSPSPTHLRDAPRLEGEGKLSMFGSPGPIVLAVTHNGVGISMGIEAGVEV